MALVVKDRVQETSTTTGTGSLTLLGAVTGFQTFSSAIGNTNATYYTIQNGAEWEVGIGTVSAGALSRDTVLESSNSGSLVDFSAGSKFVFCTYPAEKSVDIETAQTLTNKTISGAANTISNINLSSQVTGTLPVANGGTGVTTSTGSGNNVLSTSPTLVTPALGTPSSGNLANCTFPTLNQNTTGTASNVTGIVAIANGGTGGTTAQAARNNIAGATTSGQYLRGNGTNVVMSTIQAGDVPTLNQNTTGNAATATVLQTARTLNGVSFDGSANITVPTNLGITAGTTAGPIVTSSSGTNATLPTASATASGVVTTGNQTWAGTKTFNNTISGSINGNAATATVLQTARLLNGVSFNGSANITVPTNLGITAGTTAGPIVTSSSGTNATLPTASGTESGVVTTGNQTFAGTKTFNNTISGSINGNAATATALSTASGSAPSYSARAWVNFNGTGTVAIRDSGNVSSITDHAVGKYTINFTTAMPDANYSVSGSALHTDGTGYAMTVSLTSLATPVAGSCRISVAVPTIGFADPSVVDVAVFR